MTADFAIVTTVKRGFAPRLPSDLVGLILEYSNELNASLKHACINELKRMGRAWEVEVAFVYDIDCNDEQYLEGCWHITNIGGDFLDDCLKEGYHNTIGLDGDFQWGGPQYDLEWGQCWEDFDGED